MDTWKRKEIDTRCIKSYVKELQIKCEELKKNRKKQKHSFLDAKRIQRKMKRVNKNQKKEKERKNIFRIPYRIRLHTHIKITYIFLNVVSA